MTLNEAIEVAVIRTGDEKFRRLCSDDNPDTRGRDAFRRTVQAIAAIDPTATTVTVVSPPSLPVIPDAFKLGWKNCLYSTHAQDGCCGGALTCHWRGEVIPLLTCVECITEGSNTCP